MQLWPLSFISLHLSIIPYRRSSRRRRLVLCSSSDCSPFFSEYKMSFLLSASVYWLELRPLYTFICLCFCFTVSLLSIILSSYIIVYLSLSPAFCVCFNVFVCLCLLLCLCLFLLPSKNRLLQRVLQQTYVYGSQSLTSLGLDSLWAPFHSASTAREIGSAVTLKNLTLGQLP